jgi:hypothetical protein
VSFAGKWMKLQITILSKVRFRKTEYVFSHMWKTDPNTKASIIMFAIMGLLEETTGGRKEENDRK